MGYDVHITRAPQSWSDNQGHEISEDEWLDVVKSDPELRHATADELYGEQFVLWSGNNYDGAWLLWSMGNIESKNPDVAMVKKMVELADKLKARVQGDDGETYLSDGRVQRDDGSFMNYDWRARDNQKAAPKKQKAWWKIW